MDAKLTIGSILAFAYKDFTGCVPSRTLRTAYLRCYLARYGTGTTVQMRCRFLNGRKIYYGDRNVINFGSLLDGRRHAIRTGSNVSIGPEATIITLEHDPHSPEFVDKGAEAIEGDRAWICYRLIILPGGRTGEGAVVAAGAIVSKDVEPYTIVAGSPAKAVGEMTRDLRNHCQLSPWLG